ncbi:MAG: protein translocase subunit SecF [Bacteroidetes bacterium]|nr:protein translocase subunit SecF [Bacteroidota bacterium]
MRLFQNTNYDFIGNRKFGYVVSIVLLVIGLGSMAIRGLHYGIDFKGGTEIQLRFEKPVEISEVRRALNFAGINGEIKRFGGETEILVRTEMVVAADAEGQRDVTALEEKIGSGITEILKDNPMKIMRIDDVGPKIAEDMKTSAVYAILGSLLIVLIYITIRFEFKFAVSAIVATFHDVLVVLGLFSLLYGLFPGLNLEVDQTIIAAFLTIVGYSLNDTVIVFDRIREYRKIFKGDTLETVMNKSVNSTLSRTFMTSFTTFIVMIVLYIFGGETTRPFAFGMMLGIAIGTFSSIFVASALVLEWDNRISSKKLN